MTTNPIRSTMAVIGFATLLALGGCQTTNTRTTQATEKEPAPVADAFDAGAKMPPKAATLFSLAKILIAQGRDAEAATVLNNLLHRYPDHMPAYNALAEIHLRAGRADEAVGVLTAGLKRRPNDAVLLNNLGMVWFLEGHHEQALEQFERAVAAQPKEATYLANQAMALGMLGRTEEAREVYKRVLEPVDARHNLRILAAAHEKVSASAADEAEVEVEAKGEETATEADPSDPVDVERAEAIEAEPTNQATQ